MGIFSNAFGIQTGSKPTKDWIPLQYMDGGFYNTKSGIVVSEAAALTNSAAFACRRAIAESFAMLPVDIFKNLPNGGRLEEKKHPSRALLKRETNALLTPYNFLRMGMDHAIGAGNSYAELQFAKSGAAAGDVVALWPIPPNRVKPIVYLNDSDQIDLIYEVTLPDGKIIHLTKDRMLHVPGLGFDGIQGYPISLFMAQAVGLGLALDEYSALYFKQGAGMPGYVTVPDSFNEEQIRNARKHMDIHNNGIENAHRWKMLYESMKFNPASFSPVDSQMNESKVFQIQEIARFHRIPLHKIQETSKATGYSSLEQFNIEFVNDCLMPWVTNWEQEINRKFFGAEEDFYVKFNLNVLLRGDAKSRALFYRTMVFTGIMTPNEARALEDLPPLPGGDERMIPLNMTQDPEGDSDKSNDGKERIED